MTSKYTRFFWGFGSGSRQDFRNRGASKLLTSSATQLNPTPQWSAIEFQELPYLRASQLVFVLLTVAFTAGVMPGIA